MARISAIQRKSDFVNAAMDVIATHGIDGATTRRIAERAKANVAMLHYCYDSKDDLFADVYDHVARTFADVVGGIDPDLNVEDTARQILRRTIGHYLESPGFAAAAIELLNWGRRQHDDRGIAVYDQAVAAAARALLASDSTRRLDEEAIEEISFVIASLADGFAMNWVVYGNRDVALRQLDVADSVLTAWLQDRLPANALTA